MESSGNQWLLVTGAPRSGTTFLNLLLNSHPQVAIFTETGIDNIYKKLLELYSLGVITVKKYDGSMYNVEELTPSEIFDATKAYFSARFKKPGVIIVGDKMPSVLADTWELYTKAIVHCRRIIIIRRPDDVIKSSLGRLAKTLAGEDAWHIRSLQEAILEWALNWEYAAQIIDSKDVLFLSYDTFKLETDRQLTKIGQFLKIDPMFFETDFRNDKVQTQLTPDDQCVIDIILGEVQKALLVDMHDALRYFPRIHLPLNLSERFEITNRNPLSHLLLKRGFSFLEPWGVWTAANEAELAFRITDTSAKILYVTFDFTVFFGDRAKFEFDIFSGKSMTHFSAMRRDQNYLCAGGDKNNYVAGMECMPDDNGIVKIRLRIPECKSVMEAPFEDLRQLGLGILGITVLTI